MFRTKPRRSVLARVHETEALSASLPALQSANVIFSIRNIGKPGKP
jgi:hypothetical protein